MPTSRTVATEAGMSACCSTTSPSRSSSSCSRMAGARTRRSGRRSACPRPRCGSGCSGELEQVAAQLAAMHEIDYVVITAGSFDLLIEVVCEDDDELLGIL